MKLRNQKQYYWTDLFYHLVINNMLIGVVEVTRLCSLSRSPLTNLPSKYSFFLHLENKIGSEGYKKICWWNILHWTHENQGNAAWLNKPQYTRISREAFGNILVKTYNGKYHEMTELKLCRDLRLIKCKHLPKLKHMNKSSSWPEEVFSPKVLPISFTEPIKTKWIDWCQLKYHKVLNQIIFLMYKIHLV